MSVSPMARPGSWWGDRTVKTKVLASAGFAGVVAAGIGFMGLSALSTSAGAAEQLYADNTLGVARAADLDALVGDLRVNLRDTILGADPASNIAAIDTLAADFESAADAYREVTNSPAKLALLDEVTGDIAVYADFQRDVLVPLATAQDFTTWISRNAAEGTPIVTEAEGDIRELRDIESAEAKEAAAGIRAEYESERTTAILLMVVGIGVALALGWLVATGVARATAKVKHVVEGLAEGDLTRTSGLTTRDELGQMGSALDAAVDNLRGVMASVVASSDAVAAASEELSASSAQISASAEETS
ncbi:hypothetical protein IN07_15550, partial [Modestobacter caceresii]